MFLSLSLSLSVDERCIIEANCPGTQELLLQSHLEKQLNTLHFYAFFALHLCVLGLLLVSWA